MSNLVPIVPPPPKLPHVNLPQIRALPHLPQVGCVAGTAGHYSDTTFGGLPDLQALQHVKSLKKSLEEQLFALLKGQLPDLPRKIAYAERYARLGQELAALVAAFNEILGEAQSETQAAIQYVNQQISDLNAAQADILRTPAAVRTKLERLKLQRYQEYTGELNAQLGRLNQTLGCLG